MFLGQRIIRRAYGKKRTRLHLRHERGAGLDQTQGEVPDRTLHDQLALPELIAALNPVVRGWVNYYRHAAAKRTFGYLGYYVWWRVGRWLRKKHPRMSWKQIKRRYLSDDGTSRLRLALYKPARTRSRATGTGERASHTVDATADPAGPRAAAASYQEQLPLERVQQASHETDPTRVLMESRMRRELASPVRRATARNHRPKGRHGASPSTHRGASLDRPAVVPASAEFCLA